MKRLLTAVTLVLSMATTFAQTPDMNPPKEVTDLKWMVGTWTGSGDFSIQGQNITVTVTTVYSIEGQFLKAVSVNDYGVIKMEETTYTGYNAEKKEYFSYSFTNMAAAPRTEHGKLDAGVMVMTSDPWMIMDMTMSTRMTLTKISDTKFKALLEFKTADTWDKASEMELTKKS